MNDVGLVEGPKIIQLDDTIVDPAVIPVGTYDMESVTIEGRVYTVAGCRKYQFDPIR